MSEFIDPKVDFNLAQQFELEDILENASRKAERERYLAELKSKSTRESVKALGDIGIANRYLLIIFQAMQNGIRPSQAKLTEKQWKFLAEMWTRHRRYFEGYSSVLGGLSF